MTEHAHAFVFTGGAAPAVVDVCEQDWHAEAVASESDQ